MVEMKEKWSKYINRPIEKLQIIEPKWAYRKYHRKALYTQDLLKAGCVIFHAKLSEIIQYTNFNEVEINDLFTGQNRNDIRVAQILYRWDNNEFVDPPNIYVAFGNKAIFFADGRHRTKVAYFLGQTQIPIIVSKEDVPFLKEHLKLSKKPF